MSDEDKGMDMERFEEIFDFVSEKIPGLVNSLTDAIYGKAASAKFGSAVAGFFATLKTSGMTDEQAFTLTEQYMSSLNLGGVIAGAIRNHRNGDA